MIRLASTIKAVIASLQSNPLEWGERKFDYHHAEMSYHLGFHERFRVEYAVHEKLHSVYIGDIVDQENEIAGS